MISRVLFLLFVFQRFAWAAEEGYELVENVLYRGGEDELTDYQRERCRLDVYYPLKKKEFATVVWFHGGGLTGGKKHLPEGLQEQGVAVVSVNYRLYPKVKAPVYLEDSAAAVAWVFENIEKYGGSKSKVFLSGHSAGGYLVSMLGMDHSYLKNYGVDANQLAGLIPYSGHTITHFTVRKERGIDGKQPVIDKMAPLFHVRKDAPPILLITGDRELEMLGRYEENAYFYRMLKVVGHEDVELLELDGYGHGMSEPAHPLLLRFIKRVLTETK